ncbi:MAG: hypothetical protein AB1416_03875 [Actinomycetota bacterium]
MTSGHAAPSWEVTLLRRVAGGRRPRVAGKVVIEAPDVDSAREMAQAELEARANGESRWSLGVLRPLTPRAPGTHRYRVLFAEWESVDDRFVRHDVLTLDVWAADAASARRLAQQEVQAIDGYRPAWRIRSVTREGGRPKRRRAT